MIGLLYESREWSDYKLAAELAEAGCAVKMIDLALVGARDERASALMVGAALYSIRGERCDECGNCFHVCPAGAIIQKGLA